MRKTIYINKNRLDYLDIGDSQNVILFLHGAGSNSLCFKPHFDYLQTLEKTYSYRRIAVDLPGHGKSKLGKPLKGIVELGNVIRKFIIELDLKNLIIVGHSLGGGAALYLATLPDMHHRIKSVQLVNPLYFPAQKNALHIIFSVMVTEAIIAVTRYKMFKGYYLYFLSFFQNLFLQRFNYLNVGLSIHNINRYKGTLPSRLYSPVTIYWGKDDHVLPNNYFKTLTNNLPQAKFVEIEGNHSWYLKEPKVFMDYILGIKK